MLQYIWRLSTTGCRQKRFVQIYSRAAVSHLDCCIKGILQQQGFWWLQASQLDRNRIFVCDNNRYVPHVVIIIPSFFFTAQGPGGSMSQVVGLPNNSYKTITNTRGFAPGFVNYKKGCTRLATTRDKVYQLLAHSRWFSPGTAASSTTKTGRHDIAESDVKHQQSNQIKSIFTVCRRRLINTRINIYPVIFTRFKYIQMRKL